MESVVIHGSLIIDRCQKCAGVWLDEGELAFVVGSSKTVELYLEQGLQRKSNTLEKCPRCTDTCLTSGFFIEFKHQVEECPKCKGLWFDGHEFEKIQQLNSSRVKLHPPPLPEKRKVVLSRLPSLGGSSFLVMGTLYSLLFATVVFFVEAEIFSAKIGFLSIVFFVCFQFLLGPILMDWSLSLFGSLDWISIHELPAHLKIFISNVCEKNKIPIPKTGLIRDSSPQAFTFGRTPSSARLVLSRGMIELLTPEELESVVAHELGHIYHWDFVWMTLAQMVPLLLYQVYRACARRSKGKDKLFVAGLIAYCAYWVSQWLVLYLSRVREYWADQFSVETTRDPNSLVTALSKIAYGLVHSENRKPIPSGGNGGAPNFGDFQAFGILNINQSKGMTLYASQGLEEQASNIKESMQWDLWNPWATYYELQSTHPLVAKRILAISHQALHMGLSPSIIFDNQKPENYWDDFFSDLFIALLPFILGLGFVAISQFSGTLAPGNPRVWSGVVAFLFGVGAGGVIKTVWSFPKGPFIDSAIASLLKKIKVSPVTSYPVRLKGTVIGRGLAGNIFSEDMVLRDQTGIIFLDFQHGLSNIYFSFFKLEEFIGQEVIIEGWYRRAPLPYIELKNIHTQHGTSTSFSFYYRILGWGLLIVLALILRLLS